MSIGHEIGRALSFAAGMTWEILWALILGFTLSGVVQAVVSKREMRRLLPDDSPRTLLLSTGLGAASSSCSYASVALARSLFKRGADFTASMAFEFASTNLVSMSEDRVADGEARRRIADRCDRSRGLDSERHWRRAADPPASDPDQFVPVPDTRRINVDHDLVRRKLPRAHRASGSGPGRRRP